MTHKFPPASNKLVVLVGPTSSGKSELVIKLAKKFNGEIVSADSRQIYRGLNLGTGKVPGHWLDSKNRGRDFYQLFSYKKVLHHLIDFRSPKKQYSVSLFQRDAKKVIVDITKRGRLPILCGGTAHWIDAVVYNQQIPNVKPNAKLRAQLEKKSTDALYKRLIKLDPVRANNIDRYNKHRLIRALEIVITTGKPVPQLSTGHYRLPTYNILWLGLNPSKKTLHKKIDLRLKQRIKAGMIKEVTNLHRNGLSWKRLESFGLEYKYISLYLQKKLAYDEILVQISFAIQHYAKRQMTWWKRNKEIRWVADERKIGSLVEKFLK